jgi:hypothetical protein
MILPPPTIPQARAVIAHYAGPTVHIKDCRRLRVTTDCHGVQRICVYHGKKCVPADPVRYTFITAWSQDRRKIMISASWTLELGEVE